MADEQNKPAPYEVEVSRPQSTSADPQAGTSESRDLGSATVDFDAAGGLGPEDHEDAPEGDLGETSEKPGDGDPKDTEAAESDPLPDYDPESEEVQQKYDERYFTADGAINMEVLSTEFFTNLSKGNESLNEGTYAYLQKTLGLSKEAVKEVERGQMALRKTSADAFYATIDGGKEAYDAAIAWGKAGGYSEAQQAAYNEAQSKGGVAFADAAEALMARFRRATGGAEKSGRRGPPQARRPSSPTRDVTGGAQAGGGGADQARFANSAEYAKVWQDALQQEAAAKAKGDRVEMRKARDHIDAIRKKARRGYRNG